MGSVVIYDTLGYEDIYSIDERGSIYTKPRPRKDSLGRTIGRGVRKRKTKINNFGYETITLIKNKTFKTHFVHRLLVETCLRKLQHGEQVNHIDGNKLNNSLDNLEIVTQKENIKHALDLGLIKIRRGHTFKKTMLSPQQKQEIVLSKEQNKVLAKRYNVNVKTIYNIKRRCAHHITDEQ
jgi:hypothetical protein